MRIILIAIFVLGAINLSSQTLTELTISDVQEHGYYGWDIAIDGNWMAISVPADSTTFGKDAGKVDLYEYINNTWVYKQKLIPSTGEKFESFGFSIDMKNDVLVIGAIGNFDKGPFTGCTYVFENNGTSWQEVTKLYPSDFHNMMLFGYDVATNGNTIVVGAIMANGNEPESGAVYAYQKTSGSWVLSQKINPPSPSSSGERFGCSVTINNDNTIVTGAYLNSQQADKAGAAYVFEYTTSWAFSAILLPPSFSENDMFGYSLDMYDNEIAIGAFHANGSEENSGKVFVFEKEVTNWSFQYELFPSNGKRNDFFGISLALSATKLIVGASRKDYLGEQSCGAVYLYDKTTFGPATEIFEPTYAAFNNFGTAVAADDNQIIISSKLSDSYQTDGGAIYYWGGPLLGNEELTFDVIKESYYPNPAKENVTIDYYLPFTAKVELDIYDLKGSHISKIKSAKENTGSHQATWNCKTDGGEKVMEGTYIYRLSINGNVFTNKIVVID